MKAREELLGYVIKIRKRGDSYLAVENYLNLNCEDEELRKEIITILGNLEKEGNVKSEISIEKESFGINKIFGLLFIIVGILLTVFLWDKGFVSAISIILIGIGISGLTGVIK